MVEHPLAFEFSKTRTICDAFDEAWAFLQGLGSRVENDGMMARLKAFNRPESLRRTSTSSRSSNARRIGASGKAGFAPIPGFQLRYIYFLDPSARDRLTVVEDGEPRTELCALVRASCPLGIKLLAARCRLSARPNGGPAR